MTTMDVKSISWVDDVYQKFEAMCVEVEEAMYQDSVKYVENQVKTVGDCFKRFYSDVMQDLIPPSSDDPLKLEKTCQNSAHYADDGIYDKSVVYVKRGVNSESEHLGRDSDLASQLDEMVDSKLASGSYDSIGLYKLPSDKSNSVKCPGLPAKQSGSEELCFCGNNESELKVLPTEISNPENVDSQSAFLSKGSETTAELGKMSDEINGTVEYTSATSTSSDPAVDEFGKDDDMLKMSDDRNEIDSDDIDKEAFQVSEQIGKLKLDESCVLVDKYEHFSVSRLEGKERSYKKKIKDVLYLRSWSRSKNPEQLHLNVVQEEMNSPNHGSGEIAAFTCPSQSGNTTLQSNSLESGWEIL